MRLNALVQTADLLEVTAGDVTRGRCGMGGKVDTCSYGTTHIGHTVIKPVLDYSRVRQSDRMHRGR